MKSENVTFAGALGHSLAARLDHDPAAPPQAWALFAHCFTCSKDLKAVGRLSRSLVRCGFGVLRFDFTGLGDSGGDFADTNFSTNLEDLRAAIEWLRTEREAPRLLIGHSLGGAAILSVARHAPECAAIVTLAAPSTTNHIRETLLAQAPDLAAGENGDDAPDEAEVRLAGRTFRIKRQMVEDLGSHSVLDDVAALERPVLICHSPVDDTVSIDHARRIYQAAKHPKSFLSLDRADHLLLSDPADARWVAEMVATWASRYVADAEERAEDEERPALDHGQVEVRGTDGLAQTIDTWDGHRLPADEPADQGGTETGTTPYGLLAAALGACTNMTLRMYADHKKLPLDGVTTRVKHAKIHAEDCADCETEKGKIDVLEREIHIDGELTEQQVERMMQIADRCPVHRTLHSEIKIRSRRG